MRGFRTLTLVSLLGALSAFGQQSVPPSGCDSNLAATAIGACTALIDSKGASSSTLVTAYLHRATAREQLGDLSGGLADIDEALKRDPVNAPALYLHASIEVLSGNFAVAGSDLDLALLFSPGDAYAHWLRGLVKLESNDGPAAFQDFTVALTRVPGEPYYSLLLAVAEARAGLTDDGTVKKALTAVTTTAWPRPIVNFYLGKGTPASVLAAAASADPKTERERKCEAYFYIGELALLEGAREDAAQFFQQAVDTGVTTYFEHAAAGEELSRMKKLEQIDFESAKAAEVAKLDKVSKDIDNFTAAAELPAPPVAPAMRAIVPDLPEVAAQPATMQTGKYYALVIGINQYPTPLPRLKTAVADAQAIAEVLRERYGFDVKMLLDAQATRNNILGAITQYRLDLKENDNLLIYYAGHGYSDPDADKAYWLPVDADSSFSPNRIIADDLTSDVKAQPARHVLIISDSCYSGGLSRDFDVVSRSSDEATYLRKMMNGRSRNLMASGGDEPVSDSGTDGHSVFAYAVLQALAGEDKQMFTASELFVNSVKPQVAGQSDQLPEYSIIRNSSHNNGDFVFTQKQAVP